MSGEISSALEASWGRHVASTQVVQGAYSAGYGKGADGEESQWELDYKRVLGEVEAFTVRMGRRPRILVAKMGQDGHDRGAKVIASGFSDLGYDVDVGPLFSTPAEVARHAIDSDVHVIGVSSQAAGHRTLLPALISALGELNGSHIKVICGGVVRIILSLSPYNQTSYYLISYISSQIPPQDYKELYDAGVVAIFGPGTVITDAASRVLAIISKEGEGK